MKRIYVTIITVLAVICPASAQKYCQASDLNIIGKLFNDVPNPYHRIDTAVYKGFTPHELEELISPVGLAVTFRTDSKSIKIESSFGYLYEGRNNFTVSYSGFDLYIKNNEGKWVYAASTCGVTDKEKRTGSVTLINGLDGGMHECLLYLPSYSELKDCKIGVDDNAVIEAIASPFRHRIAYYGSSFTQGVGTSRAGMSYPLQVERATGFETVSVGMSGRCLMQAYSSRMLQDLQADAFVFDTFSNPDSYWIKQRTKAFIDEMIAAHPGVPMIFQQTIYREGRNFNTASDKFESDKIAEVINVFKGILGDPKYKDVYLIFPDASCDNETSVDGTHPGDYGYTLWAKSITPEILNILSRYGIK